MALHYLAIASFSPSHFLAKPNLVLSKSTYTVPCRASNTDGFVLSSVTSGNKEKTTVVRRSANYKPPLWDYDYIQSLQSHYVGEPYKKRASELRGEVRMMIEEMVEDDPSKRLELIDVLQRLGLSYHFEIEIEKMLKNIYNDIDHFREEKGNDLYVVALAFRLLRQHHFNIPQEIFSDFMSESGNFKESLSTDVNQILCLYEATYFSVEDEQILKKARDFATKHLEEYVKNHEHNEDQNNSEVEMVKHALELPLHWRMPRLETNWFIDVYEKKQDHHHLLLELSKLDYNMVQAIHQQDLHQVSRWWKSTGFAENLSFARDRVMENFIWAMGTASEPQFMCCRKMAAKYNALITTLDDVYDVYGTLDELKLFTDVIQRWDLSSMKHLPEYMRVFFVVLDNHVNEMASLPLNTQGIDITPYLKNAWAHLSKVYMVEAEWYYSGYTPTLKEFIDNSWVSIGAPVILVHAYFLTTDQVTREALDFLHPNSYHNIIRWSSTILRLADDMGTSSEEIKRGDVPKSIQCYMHETGASEEEARDYIRHLIDATWEKMNRDRVAGSPFSRDFIRIAMNYSRMAQCMYLHGDGHASQDEFTRSRVHSLLVQPFLL